MTREPNKGKQTKKMLGPGLDVLRAGEVDNRL